MPDLGHVCCVLGIACGAAALVLWAMLDRTKKQLATFDEDLRLLLVQSRDRQRELDDWRAEAKHLADRSDMARADEDNRTVPPKGDR